MLHAKVSGAVNNQVVILVFCLCILCFACAVLLQGGCIMARHYTLNRNNQHTNTSRNLPKFSPCFAHQILTGVRNTHTNGVRLFQSL